MTHLIKVRQAQIHRYTGSLRNTMRERDWVPVRTKAESCPIARPPSLPSLELPRTRSSHVRPPFEHAQYVKQVPLRRPLVSPLASPLDGPSSGLLPAFPREPRLYRRSMWVNETATAYLALQRARHSPVQHYVCAPKCARVGEHLFPALNAPSKLFASVYFSPVNVCMNTRIQITEHHHYILVLLGPTVSIPLTTP